MINIEILFPMNRMELNVSLYVAILANYISLIFASENLPMTKNICGK